MKKTGATQRKKWFTRKKQSLRDGALELAAAIASLSETVRLDASSKPFVTDPTNLFECTFHDVGIGDGQMALLREQLKQLLPEIASDLDENARILDRAGHCIESYAAFLRVALLLKSA